MIRFWKTPVKGPCDAAPPPKLRNWRFDMSPVLAGPHNPSGSTIVMPGKKEEPNVLMPACCGEKGCAIVL